MTHNLKEGIRACLHHVGPIPNVETLATARLAPVFLIILETHLIADQNALFTQTVRAIKPV